MSEQRNLILAILLSLGVFVGWSYFHKAPPDEQPKGEASTLTTEGSVLPPLPAADTAAVPTISAPVAAPVKTRGESILDSGPRIAIRTGKLEGSILLQGGRIDDLTLSTYRQTVEPDSPPVDLLSPVGSPHPYYAEFGWLAGTDGLAVPSPTSIWTADRTTLTSTDPVTLTWDNGQGLQFVRKISVDQNYMFTISQTVINNGQGSVSLYPYARISREQRPPTANYFILHEGLVGVVDGTLKEIGYDKVKEDKIDGMTTGGWVGITDKYWLTALVPDQTQPVSVRMLDNPTNGKANYQTDFRGEALNVAPGQSASVESRFFAGAKEYNLLTAYESDLGITNFKKAIDFGWFSFFTIPFTWALHHLYQWLGNMGLAIMAFTVVLKILFFPLANKSYVSMSKMKLLAPELKKLQERFKDDRVRLNQEMMALYQKEKVNPLSGCLPIVLQIPVFFALYKVIFVNIDMRHAPFFGWITDLSVREPITVFNLFGLIPWTPPDFQLFWVGTLPLLMGFTMWLQQKLNPAPTDPTQAKIIGLLPYIFTFVLAPFAAGLILYWTWNNALSIVQQWVIMKRLDRQKKRAAA